MTNPLVTCWAGLCQEFCKAVHASCLVGPDRASFKCNITPFNMLCDSVSCFSQRNAAHAHNYFVLVSYRAFFVFMLGPMLSLFMGELKHGPRKANTHNSKSAPYHNCDSLVVRLFLSNAMLQLYNLNLWSICIK